MSSQWDDNRGYARRSSAGMREDHPETLGEFNESAQLKSTESSWVSFDKAVFENLPVQEPSPSDRSRGRNKDYNRNLPLNVDELVRGSVGHVQNDFLEQDDSRVRGELLPNVQPGILPEFKDQVQGPPASRRDRKGVRTSKLGSHSLTRRDDLLHPDMASHGSIEAVAVIVGERKMKLILWIILGLANILVLAGFIVGGPCIIDRCLWDRSDGDDKSLLSSENTNTSCTIDMEISCRDTHGLLCSELNNFLAGSCTRDVTAIEVWYESRSCDDPRSDEGEDDGWDDDWIQPLNDDEIWELSTELFNCTDYSPFLNTPTEVICVEKENGKPLSVNPRFVSNYDRLKISSFDDGILAGSVRCSLFSQSGRKIQVLDFHLNTLEGLRNSFLSGSFGYARCSNPFCQEVLTHYVTIRNNNQYPMDIETVDWAPPNDFKYPFEFGSSPIDVGSLEVLHPGEEVTLSMETTVDMCSFAVGPLDIFYHEVAAPWVYVGARLSNGAECRWAQEHITRAPFPQDCQLSVDIDCVTPDGVDCQTVEVVSTGSCGSQIVGLNLRFNDEVTCSPVMNSQGDRAACKDIPRNRGISEVQVKCYDSEGSILDPIGPHGSLRHPYTGKALIYSGDTFEVFFTDDRNVTTIHCDLFRDIVPDSRSHSHSHSRDRGLIQQITIDVSGEIELSRGDRFGALEVVGCWDETLCDSEILTYNISIRNTGSVPFQPEEFMFHASGGFHNNDEPASLPLVANQGVSFQRPVQFIPCLGEQSRAIVSVTGRTSRAGVCEGEALYGERKCAIGLAAACSLGDGSHCSRLERRHASCSESQMFALHLVYRAGTCGQQSSLAVQCADFAPLVESPDIECFDNDGLRLTVLPVPLRVNGFFSLYRPDGQALRGIVDCVFRKSDRTILQRNTIDISKLHGIADSKKFGGIDLYGCSDSKCKEAITVNISLTNNGLESVSITDLDLFLEPYARFEPLSYLYWNPKSFTAYLSDQSLDPLESTAVSAWNEFDTCHPRAYFDFFRDLQVSVYAKSASGAVCHGGDLDVSCREDGIGCGGGPGYSAPLFPDTVQPPLDNPPMDESQTLSPEAIFGLVAAGVVVEFLVCVGLYFYYQQWKRRRAIQQEEESQFSTTSL